jgi:hypothetical protein
MRAFVLLLALAATTAIAEKRRSNRHEEAFTYHNRVLCVFVACICLWRSLDNEQDLLFAEL